MFQNPCGSQGATSEANATDASASAPAAAPAPPRARQRGQRHPAQIGRAQLPYGQRQIRVVLGPLAGSALVVACQPPTPRVPGAEGVVDVEDDIHRRLVRTRLQGRAQFHEPYEHAVPHPHFAPPDVIDEMQQRIVQRPVARHDLHRQVDVEEEAPQHGVRHRVERLDVPQGDAALGTLRIPVRLGVEAHETDDLALPLGDHALHRRGAVPLALGVEQRQPLPAGPASEHAGP